MEKYTVQTVIPTGKNHPTFGTEFHVKFAENEGTFKLWYKEAPQEGKVQYGTIDGWKFKKASKQDLENAGITSSPAGNAGSASAPARSSKPAYKDNSDGMRQGMCFNNAAAYVAAISPEPLSPRDWAKAVNSYAQALYLVSELSKEVQEAPKEVTLAEAPKSVQDVFGASPANK